MHHWSPRPDRLCATCTTGRGFPPGMGAGGRFVHHAHGWFGPPDRWCVGRTGPARVTDATRRDRSASAHVGPARRPLPDLGSARHGRVGARVRARSPGPAERDPGRSGDRHWTIFERRCRTAGVKRNLVPDAYVTALAIETGSEPATTDRDFSRIPGLRWRHSLSGGRGRVAVQESRAGFLSRLPVRAPRGRAGDGNPRRQRPTVSPASPGGSSRSSRPACPCAA